MQAHPQSSPAASIPSSAHPFGTTIGSFPSPLTTLAHNAGLAHDAGNLLGALGLYCDLLRSPGVLRPEHHHYAQEISLISSRSSDLIRRLLNTTYSNTPQPVASRASAPRPALLVEKPTVRSRFSPFSDPNLDPTALYCPGNHPSLPDLQPRPGLAAALQDLAPILNRIAAGVARVTVLVPNSLPTLALCPEILERITVNLVRNAAEAIRSNTSPHIDSEQTDPVSGRILVTLAIVNGRLQLSVDDNGPGMPPALASAFLRPSPLPPGDVRGLGHRIIHELVTSNGGQLSIRSRTGSGTSFYIKWPVPSATEGGA